MTVYSDPTESDTDGDGLDDAPETRENGVTLDVFRKTVVIDGTPYSGPFRYDYDNEQTTPVTIDTNPMNEDSDGDGLTDGKEQNEYHTRADREISYNITRVHQERIVDPLVDANDVDRLEALGLLTSRDVRDLETERLTDATDDFDLVTADDGSLVFTALDRTDRTDTWLSNREELAIGTDPWDPDHDDDRLTDGQEAKWLTTAEEVRFRSGPVPDVTRYEVERGELIGTNASKNDTADDGYWDGRIGVHGVERAGDASLPPEPERHSRLASLIEAAHRDGTSNRWRTPENPFRATTGSASPPPSPTSSPSSTSSTRSTASPGWSSSSRRTRRCCSLTLGRSRSSSRPRPSSSPSPP
jgi:hypothetical protein